MARYALVNKDQEVVRVILLEPTADYQPRKGLTAIPAPVAEVGWVWDGSTFNPPVLPPLPVVIPQVISKLQAELTVGESTVNTIESFMNSADSPWAMKRAWASASSLERDSQMVDELAYVLGWTEEDIDNLFISASQVKV